MKTFLLSLAGAFVAILLFIIVSFLALGALIGAASASDPQPDEIILSLDLRSGYTDQAPTSGLAAFSGTVGFTDLLVKLDRARADEDVKGIFIRSSESVVGSSRSEELRDALIAFKESGKFVIAHSQGFFASSPSSYRSIAAADEIWIQQGTSMGVTGISFETPFIKGMLDDLSITAEFEAIGEFKNAPNTFRNETYTEPHRLALAEVADSLWTVSLADIATDRGLEVADLRAALEAGMYDASELIDLGLVDRLGWPEDAREAARERAGENAEFVSLSSYVAPAAPAGAPMIAVLGGEGTIVTGGGGSDDPFAESVGFGSDRVARAILDAGKNEKVQAIVFRVDSGGGSATASSHIWNAVERVQADGTPVIVTMGSTAASGGYYVSAGADHILANDTTITGSIGIFAGKFAVAEGLERIGVNFENVTVGGEWTEAFGGDRFTDYQRNELRKMTEAGYEEFVNIVAEGRGMTYDEVNERARGRIWTGEDALELGLVDSIGGFLDAIDVAKELAGIEADTDVRLVYYPARLTGLEALESAFSVSAQSAEGLASIAQLANDPHLQALIRDYQAAASSQGDIQARGPSLIER
ncbi:MAG: signal peptide peptidase SppA [Pseudomonadota bacterium]